MRSVSGVAAAARWSPDRAGPALGWGGWRAIGVAMALLLVPWRPASAQPQEVAAEKAPVELDRLLELPDTLEYGVERRGGATPGEWRERFRQARSELEEARRVLSETEDELAGLGESSEAWQLAPPGSTAAHSEAPLSYQLRMRIRRQREEVERAEKRLRDLEIEANLANVPEDWRR